MGAGVKFALTGLTCWCLSSGRSGIIRSTSNLLRRVTLAKS